MLCSCDGIFVGLCVALFLRDGLVFFVFFFLFFYFL